jgi:hypothetical protein
MTMYTWLGLALAVAVIAALTGMKPKGSRPVAGTRLMGVARVILILVVLLFVYLAVRG